MGPNLSFKPKGCIKNIFIHPESLKTGCVPYCEGSEDFILWDIIKNEAELLRSTSKTEWRGIIILLCPSTFVSSLYSSYSKVLTALLPIG